MVIRGAHEYPGAVAVEDELGRVILLHKLPREVGAPSSLLCYPYPYLLTEGLPLKPSRPLMTRLGWPQLSGGSEEWRVLCRGGKPQQSCCCPSRARPRRRFHAGAASWAPQAAIAAARLCTGKPRLLCSHAALHA